MRHAVAPFIVCSFTALIAPSPSPLTIETQGQAGANERLGCLATECPEGSISIYATKVCGTKDGKRAVYKNKCEAERAGATHLKLGMRSAGTSVVAQASTGVAPAPTSIPGIAGEPIRQPQICS